MAHKSKTSVEKLSAGEYRSVHLWYDIRDSLTVFELKGTPALLLMVLASRTNGPPWMCYPTYTRIAKDTGGANKEVLRTAAKRLEDLGLISRTFRTNQSNEFTISVKKIAEAADAEREKDRAGRERRKTEDKQQGQQDQAEHDEPFITFGSSLEKYVYEEDGYALPR